MRNKIAKKLRKGARLLKIADQRVSVRRTTQRLKKLHKRIPKNDRYYELSMFLLNATIKAKNAKQQSESGISEQDG